MLPVALFDLYKVSNKELAKELGQVLGTVEDIDINLVEELWGNLDSYRRRVISRKVFIKKVRAMLPSKCGACGICIGPDYLETSGVDLPGGGRLCSLCGILIEKREFLQLNYITRLLPSGEEIRARPEPLG